MSRRPKGIKTYPPRRLASAPPPPAWWKRMAWGLFLGFLILIHLPIILLDKLAVVLPHAYVPKYGWQPRPHWLFWRLHRYDWWLSRKLDRLDPWRLRG